MRQRRVATKQSAGLTRAARRSRGQTRPPIETAPFVQGLHRSAGNRAVLDLLRRHEPTPILRSAPLPLVGRVGTGTGSVPVVHRKIDLEKVNIVGEHHPDEDKTLEPEDVPRRDVEKRMVGEYYNVPYFTEDQFTDDYGRLGDPPRQRTMTSFGLLATAVDMFSWARRNVKFPLQEADTSRLSKSLDHIDEETAELIGNLKRQQNQATDLWTGFFHFDAEKLAELREVTEKDMSRTVIGAGEAFRKNPPPTRDTVDTLAHRLKGHIEQLKNLLGTRSPQSAMEGSIFPRSMRMFLVANRLPQQQPSIWKVGELHVQDILKQLGKDTKHELYELKGATVTPEKHFTYELNRWRRLRRRNIL